MARDSVVGQLQDERNRLHDELKRLDQAIELLTKGKGPMGRRGGRRQMSPEARQRIADAQKARWAKQRGEQTAADAEAAVKQGKKGKKKGE